MTLRVAMDATAVPSRLTGAGVYVAGLLGALDHRADVEVTVFLTPAGAAAIRGVVGSPRRLRVATVLPRGGRAARIGWTQLLAGRKAASARAGLLHGVHYELPARAAGAEVVTVHDLTMFTHPEWHERTKVAYFRWATTRAVRRARRVLCVSAATAADLCHVLGVDPAKVDVTPLGTSLRPAAEVEVAAVRERLGLRRPYILGLGTLEPRKDTPALVGAFGRLAAELPHDLVLAGLRGWGGNEIGRAVSASGLAGRVRLVGYVPEAAKAALFTGADAFCYPSRYEGFGLPVLEAMACGTPVVTTRGGAIPEVTGPDGALLCEPGDVAGLAAGITRLFRDHAVRRDLVAAGRRRAAAFTWDGCATATMDGYRRALAA